MENKNTKKILIIGPVYPYKGGISQYTSLLYKILAIDYKVSIISFKLQYPKFLYPGNEQKDYKNNALEVKNTKFILNTINPFSYIKTALNIKKSEVDFVIFQWWHPYFFPAYFLILKIINKSTKILFICHNVLPHEKIFFDKIVTKLLLKQVNYFILHSKKDEKDLLSIIKNPNYVRTVIPTFNFFKIKGMNIKIARKILEFSENDKILLFFGFIREYKGLKYLINAMPKICNEIDNCKLLIVGNFYKNKPEYMEVIKNSGVEDNIIIFDDYIPDDEVEKFFVASDVVVLPYKSATQSGVVQIAYSFEKPVIATSVGGLPEVVIDGKTGYIVDACNSNELADAVIKFFCNNNIDYFKQNISKEAYKYSWGKLSNIISNFYFT